MTDANAVPDEMVEAGVDILTEGSPTNRPHARWVVRRILTAAFSIRDGWRTIDSAPKDGSRILVTRADPNGREPTRIAWAYPSQNRWRIGLNKSLRYEPTHWMPLPSAPSTGEET